MPTILITGASRGIGLEFTHQYLDEGCDVIATCRTPEKADALNKLATQNKHLRIEVADVSDEKSLKALAAKLNGTAIDILINNAGIISGARETSDAQKTDISQDFGSLDPAAWSRVFLTNSIAPIIVIQALLSNLSKGGGKKVANISSRMGSITEMVSGDRMAYRTSKAALNAALRCITPDLKNHHIAVVNFHPGWVQTDMGGAAAAVTPTNSVRGMRKLIASLSLANSGQFLTFDGNHIPW